MANDDEVVQTVSFRDLRAKQFPPDLFLISDGLLPRDGIMFIAGPPKSYKSFLMGTIIHHLILGTNLFGTHKGHVGHIQTMFNVCGPQRVLFLEQEIGLADVRERFYPLWERLTPTEQEMVDSHLFIHSRDHTMRLDDKPGWNRVRDVIAAVKPTVVCFDPFIEFHHQDENNAQTMSSVLYGLDRLRNAYGFASILSHHTGKPDPQNFRTGPDLMRGSSVIFGKGDAFIMLTPIDRELGHLRLDFTIRRGRPLDHMTVILDWQELRAKFIRWGEKKTKLPAGVKDTVLTTQ